MSSSLLGVRRISQRGCVFLLPVCQFSFVPGCRISLCSTLLHSSSHLCFSAAMSSLLSSISGSPPANACLACCSSRTWEKVSPLKNVCLLKTLSMQPIILLLRILMSWPSSSEESESESEDWSRCPCTGITCQRRIKHGTPGSPER